MDVNQLILYRNIKENDLFCKMSDLIGDYMNQNFSSDLSEEIGKACSYASQFFELSFRYGFRGNVWINFLAMLLASSENAYSLSSEMRENISDPLEKVVLSDMKLLYKFMKFDLKKIDKELGIECFSFLENYENQWNSSRIFQEDVVVKIWELGQDLYKASDINEFLGYIRNFYKNSGVGRLGLHKAFTIIPDTSETIKLQAIQNIENISLNDLVGYERQKNKLVENTLAFLSGRKANNVLLFGDSGTGKSSSIKAVLNEYYNQGLRMIEVYKHQFKYLIPTINQIKDRNYKFIIFMDDLSFEDYEVEYKYLKAIIEGGLASRPDNVLIYATSNRRHLVREKWSDKEDRREDLHTSDTVQEKLSLAARFGVTIFYDAPNKSEFATIVLELAKKKNLNIPKEKLLEEAYKWEMSHGGRSGRNASQFINNIAFSEKNLYN